VAASSFTFALLSERFPAELAHAAETASSFAFCVAFPATAPAGRQADLAGHTPVIGT
jgi:hypothetical protein